MADKTATASGQSWLPALQSLRGLAALWVVVYHLQVHRFSDGKPLFPIPGLRFGWLGVDVFFVLSAFLLCRPFLRETPPSLRRFWTDRFLRIAPCYYAAFVVATAVILWLFRANANADLMWPSLVFIQNHRFETHVAVNPVFWSLAVEMQFYLVLPFMARIYKTRHWPWVTVALLLASALYRAIPQFIATAQHQPVDEAHNFLVTFSLPAFLGHFALGMAAARIGASWRPGGLLPIGLLLILATPALMIREGSIAFGWESLSEQLVVRTLVAVGCGLVVLDAATPGTWSRILSWSPLNWLGDVSYPLYLIHLPILLALSVKVGSAEHPWLFSLLTVGGSILAAWLMHIAVEDPAERWRHRRRQARTQTASTGGSA